MVAISYVCLVLLIICISQPFSFGQAIHYNATRADLGHRFFRRLVDDEQSYTDINEESLCSLMHFFFREASHNGEPVQFSSGKATENLCSSINCSI